MHDIRKIREKPNDFDNGLSRRFHKPLSADILNLDRERRAKILDSEKAQAEKNIISDQVKHAKMTNDSKSFQDGRDVLSKAKVKISSLEMEAKEHDDKLKQLLLTIPNIPDTEIPDGKDENQNLIIRSWGKPRKFNFSPKEHFLISGAKGLNFQAAAKISGSRFVVMEGAMATLHRALAQFMINTQIYGFGS